MPDVEVPDAKDAFDQSVDDFLKRRSVWLDKYSDEYDQADAKRVEALLAHDARRRASQKTGEKQ